MAASTGSTKGATKTANNNKGANQYTVASNAAKGSKTVSSKPGQQNVSKDSKNPVINNAIDNRSQSNLKKNGGGAGPGSDSFSGQESFGGDKDEREAFWCLVRLFINCHEGENKDYKSEGVDKIQAAGGEMKPSGGSKTTNGKANSSSNVM